MAFCPQCGNKVLPTDRFCNKCGTKLISGKPPNREMNMVDRLKKTVGIIKEKLHLEIPYPVIAICRKHKLQVLIALPVLAIVCIAAIVVHSNSVDKYIEPGDIYEIAENEENEGDIGPISLYDISESGENEGDIDKTAQAQNSSQSEESNGSSIDYSEYVGTWYRSADDYITLSNYKNGRIDFKLYFNALDLSEPFEFEAQGVDINQESNKLYFKQVVPYLSNVDEVDSVFIEFTEQGLTAKVTQQRSRTSGGFPQYYGWDVYTSKTEPPFEHENVNYTDYLGTWVLDDGSDTQITLSNYQLSEYNDILFDVEFKNEGKLYEKRTSNEIKKYLHQLECKWSYKYNNHETGAERTDEYTAKISFVEKGLFVKYFKSGYEFENNPAPDEYMFKWENHKK